MPGTTVYTRAMMRNAQGRSLLSRRDGQQSTKRIRKSQIRSTEDRWSDQVPGGGDPLNRVVYLGPSRGMAVYDIYTEKWEAGSQRGNTRKRILGKGRQIKYGTSSSI